MERWAGRGYPWEFDPGPPRNRRWGRLFAATPNYRGLGLAVTGREAFRWHFGPVFYRGRLGDGQVKVLVIGQEGAQDESLASRAFVGGTGARLQHVLGHLGITRSYLYLNTFVYPIFGQYSKALRWLGQGPDSPIAQHRNLVLDYVAERNDLRLVVAVGTAAKESVVSWVASRGGHCGAGTADVARCDTSVLGTRTRAVGVLHPGGGARGGDAAAAVADDFRRALDQVEAWAEADPGWLPPDDGERLPAEAFRYGAAPIPFRDLPYGVCWRLGRGATSSNRADGQRSIQLFGAGGVYNARGQALEYPSTAAGSAAGYDAPDGDLAYEPPRRSWGEFDRGPPPRYARLLQGGVAGLEWPDFAALGVPGDGSLGTGPVYRGRFHGVRVLVLADQQSHDDVFCGRALCGEAGQRLHGVLEAMGVARDYLVLRTLPVDTLGLAPAVVRAAVDHPRTRALHSEVLARLRAANPQLPVLLAVGPHAGRLAEGLPTGSLQVLHLRAWRQSGARADWQRAGERLRAAGHAGWDGHRRQIPRADLPYGSVRWRGTSGDRASRPLLGGAPSPHYVKLSMPEWAARLQPEPLSAADQAAVDRREEPPWDST